MHLESRKLQVFIHYDEPINYCLCSHSAIHDYFRDCQIVSCHIEDLYFGINQMNEIRKFSGFANDYAQKLAVIIQI